MWRFFAQIILFIGIVFSLSFLFLHRPLMEYTPGYAKATHRANSLIMGGSRAGQGLNPDTIQAVLGREDVMLNFAFNGFHSPYGPSYYRAMQRKVLPETKDGLFILSVNAGLLSDLEQDRGFREDEFGFYKLYFMNLDPNVEYMLRDLGSERGKQVSPLLRLLSDTRLKQGKRKLHPNGWMEMLHASGQATARADERFEGMRPNPVRLEYLKKTIAYLQQFGQVVLVRLPTGSDYWAHESQAYPHFEEDMQALCDTFGIPFFDYFRESYPFHDINQHHLISAGANAFSADLARSIQVWKADGRVEVRSSWKK